MKNMFESFVPYLGGAFLAILTYFFGKKRQNEENRKLHLEAQSVSIDNEVKLIKFYQEQVIALTQKYEELCEKLEEKIEQYDDCVEKVEKLEKMCSELIKEVKQLKNES